MIELIVLIYLIVSAILMYVFKARVEWSIKQELNWWLSQQDDMAPSRRIIVAQLYKSWLYVMWFLIMPFICATL